MFRLNSFISVSATMSAIPAMASALNPFSFNGIAANRLSITRDDPFAKLNDLEQGGGGVTRTAPSSATQPALTPQQSQRLCLALAHCDTEAAVIQCLTEHGLWDNPEHWRLYGDLENNFGVIGGQSSRPEGALAEKLINSMDAILMAACVACGIDPRSQEAPQSMKEGLQDFFGIKDGSLENLSIEERESLASRIRLVASGSKSKPCLTIIDDGEGQTADTMPSTLLSISLDNKFWIAFVQGMHNAGGTGALQFCGKEHMELIITKRDPLLTSNTNDDHWAFTVVRRVNPGVGDSSSSYKYLAPGGKVLSFPAESMPLLPGPYPHQTGEAMTHGTFIRLYEYDVSSRNRGNITQSMHHALSLLFPNPALPIRLHERRESMNPKAADTTVSSSVQSTKTRSEFAK